MTLERWWCGIAGLPTRAFTEALSRRVPHDLYGDIRLVVTDAWLAPEAERLFAATKEALAVAAAGAPSAYTALRADVRRIVFTSRSDAPRYQRFLLAAVVSPRVALPADAVRYAAWLLQTSAYFHGENEADARVHALLRSLDPDQRSSIREWLRESLVDWREL